MLAGERFSDRPRCVDPVLAAFMRDLNDAMGEVSRQRLKPYAPLVIGTAGDRAARRARRDRCLAFAAGRRIGAGGPPRLARLRVLAAVGVAGAIRLDRGAAQWAVRALGRRGVEPNGFALLEALIDDGRPLPTPPPTPPAPTDHVMAGSAGTGTDPAPLGAGTQGDARPPLVTA